MLNAPDPWKPLVLVVENEPILRMSAVDMVRGAGFPVVEAVDVADAVRLLESRPDIRIVFSDIDMPHGADGASLSTAIRRRQPLVEVILTSGRLDPGADALPVRSVFLPKPYKPEDVLAVMRHMAG